MYEKDTGRKVSMPSNLGHLLGDPSIKGGLADINEEEEKKTAAEMEGLQKTTK